MICNNCYRKGEIGAFKATLVRNDVGETVGFKSIWICEHCGNLPAMGKSVIANWRGAETQFIQKPSLKPSKRIGVPRKKIDFDIKKLKQELLQFDEKEKRKAREETHQQFRLFCKKYFNEQ